MQQSLKVAVVIGGVKRDLFYPKGAYRFMLEHMPDVDFDKVRAAIKAGQDTPAVRKMAADADLAIGVMLCAGLLHDDLSMTPEKVEFMIIPDEVDAAVDAANRAMDLTKERAIRPRSAPVMPQTGTRRGRSRR